MPFVRWLRLVYEMKKCVTLKKNDLCLLLGTKMCLGQ